VWTGHGWTAGGWNGAGWGTWQSGDWDNDWALGLGVGLAGFALGATIFDPYAYWGGWGPYWGWGWGPTYAAYYDTWYPGYWDDWSPWDYGYGWPSAYYGSSWPWWRHHHHRRWRGTYAGYYGYDYGQPNYYDPGYAAPAVGPGWNGAYLTDAAYTPQYCVERSYVWDDYYGGYVARRDYAPC
jgi:hypothetical protein